MGAVQMGGIPITNGDVTVQNYGLTDIPAGVAVIWDTANTPVPLGTTAPGVTLVTAAGAVTPAAGITVERIPAGGNGRLRKLGGYPVQCEGTVTLGDCLQIGNTVNKLGRVKTCGAATQQIGTAMNGGVDGDLVQVWIGIANNA